MTQIFPEAFADAKAHARREFPKESCGLIVGGRYLACENVAQSPDAHVDGDRNCSCKLCSFEIDEQVFLQHSGKIDMIVHSHPNGPLYPSQADMEAQIATGVPWAIIAIDDERSGDPIIWGDSLPIAPLLGRQFMHGVHDCYSLIRDTFRIGRESLAEQGVTEWPFDPVVLPDFPRNDAWWDDGEDLYDANFKRVGWFEIKQHEARPGDAFFMKIRSSRFNHAGLLIGQGLILHHLPSRLSRREPAGLWGRNAGRWLRFGGASNA